jgi:hypothetical protein
MKRQPPPVSPSPATLLRPVAALLLAAGPLAFWANASRAQALPGRPAALAQAAQPARAPQPQPSDPLAPYAVQPGDTLIGLGRSMLVPPSAWREVARLNKLPNPNRIQPGQTLLIPLRLLRGSDAPAQVVGTTGDVRLDGQALAVAASGATPAVLHVGQLLTTAASSSAVVQLGDGSRVQIAPGSEFGLGESRLYVLRPAHGGTKAAAQQGAATPSLAGAAASTSAPAGAATATDASVADGEGLFAHTMRLIQGSIEVFATKVLRAKPLEVETPTAVIGVRGTDYRVQAGPAALGVAAAPPASAAAALAPAADADQSTRTEVLTGLVRADTVAAAPGTPAAQANPPALSQASLPAGPASGADVPAGFGAALRPGQPPTVVPLLPAPDLTGVPARFERPVVRIEWPSAGLPARVQVAADNGFERVVRDEIVPPGAPARLLGLDDGTWQLRVRSIDAQGIEGRDAQRAFTLKARPEPPAPSEPAARAKLSVGSVHFAWAENLQATHYRIEVAQDAGFAQPVFQAQDWTGGQQQVTLDQPGAYFWRLGSVRADGDQGPWGDTQSFELRPLPSAPSGGLSSDGRTLALRWSGRAEDRQQVELARDIAFSQGVTRADLGEAEWSVPRPDVPGTYYFRYRSVESDGFVSPWSSTLKISVPRDWTGVWLLLLPALFAL